MRRRRHQQEGPREGREELPEPVTPGVLDLAAEGRGRHPVRLVADHEVPPAVGRLELPLDGLVARELVEPSDDQVGLPEPVAGAGGLELVVGEDLEREVEPAVELVPPRLGKAGRAGDQAPLEVAAGGYQLLDQQARHDGLAGAGVVGEQEAERLAGQHRLIDGGDLVGKGVDDGGVHRQDGVEEVGQADSERLRDEPEQRAVAVEAPRPALLHQIEPGLVVPIEQLVGHLAGGRLVGEFDRIGAEPLQADHGHHRVRDDPADRGVRLSCSSVIMRRGPRPVVDRIISVGGCLADGASSRAAPLPMKVRRGHDRDARAIRHPRRRPRGGRGPSPTGDSSRGQCAIRPSRRPPRPGPTGPGPDRAHPGRLRTRGGRAGGRVVRGLAGSPSKTAWASPDLRHPRKSSQ